MNKIILGVIAIVGGVVGVLPLTAKVVHAQTCMVSPTTLSVVSGRFGKSRGANEHGSAASTAHMHGGLDFSTARVAQPVFATSDGVIADRRYSPTGGNLLDISRPHGGVVRYMHLSSYSPDIVKGAEVKAGQQVGLSGNTPADAMTVHLHLEYGVKDKADARAVQFPSNPSGSAFDPKSLQSVKTYRNGMGYRTDPSPYFCQTFPINDGHPEDISILGADTKAQYEILFGSVPEGGTPPEISDVGAAAGNMDILLGEDNFSYGAIPDPPIGGLETDSMRTLLLTEAYRRFGSYDWSADLARLSQRGLIVDYDRLQGTRLYLEHAIDKKRAHVEMLMALYVSLKIEESGIDDEVNRASTMSSISQISQ